MGLREVLGRGEWREWLLRGLKKAEENGGFRGFTLTESMLLPYLMTDDVRIFFFFSFEKDKRKKEVGFQLY